jgi:hypothetical protein
LANLLADVKAMKAIGQRVLDGLAVAEAAAEVVGQTVALTGRSAEAAAMAEGEGMTVIITEVPIEPRSQGIAELFDDAAAPLTASSARRASTPRQRLPVPRASATAGVTLDY